MGIADKFDAAKDKVTGKVKEALGKATHDHSQVAEGKVDQAKGEAKDKIADAKAHLKADAKAHLKEDRANLHTDDTEGGSRGL
ncbi:CsbD family protein [Arthrobacter alpinus]|nr:CsbD family protein [Arthrobacter alpinus]